MEGRVCRQVRIPYVLPGSFFGKRFLIEKRELNVSEIQCCFGE